MNDLVPVVSDDAREDGVTVSSYLPIITVHSKNSNKLTDPDYAYTIPMIGKMVVIDGGKYELLGSEVQAVYLGYRRKATRYLAGEYSSVLVDTHTAADPVKYQEWRAKAKNRVQGYKYGLEFLVYLPEYNKFGTVFMGTDFERKVGSTKILDAVDQKHHNFTLFLQPTGPQAKYPRTVIAAKADDFTPTAPDEDEMRNAIERFLNPPAYLDDPGDDRS